MAYFPFFVELSGRSGLVVGGGHVALRKVEKLLPYGPALTLVAPEIIPELKTLPGLDWNERPFLPSDLEGAFFVIAATDDSNLNHTISRLCRQAGIPVNVVDDKAACTFLFPALVQRGDLSVGISTGGASPTAAIWLKDQINALLPEELDAILLWLEHRRSKWRTAIPQPERRAALSAALFSACMKKGAPLTGEEEQNIVCQEEIQL